MPTDHAAIIEREFRLAAGLPAATPLAVAFAHDETILVTVAGTDAYVMEIGSDDDEFIFVGPNREVVRFPIPDDYLEVDE